MTELVPVYKDDHFYLGFIWLAEKHGKTRMKERTEKLMDYGFYIEKTNKTRGLATRLATRSRIFQLRVSDFGLL